MQIQTLINGTVRIILSPTNAMETEIIKQLKGARSVTVEFATDNATIKLPPDSIVISGTE